MHLPIIYGMADFPFISGFFLACIIFLLLHLEHNDILGQNKSHGLFQITISITKKTSVQRLHVLKLQNS